MNWIRTRYVFLAALVIVGLINEFTLSFLDNNPPLSESTLDAIRKFDLFVLIVALLYKQIFLIALRLLKIVSNFLIHYFIPIFIAIFILDIILGLIGIGYPSDFNQENIKRFPSPSDSFRGKPNVADHNHFGFRGDFKEDSRKFNIAIFGGSTTYEGNPPIIEIIAKKLNAKGVDINTFNLGSVSSNHSQHVHRLLEFSDKFNFDLVIFYGGGNESLQYATYDPRPGYPYNFFFRNELAPWKQALLRKSSIIGAIDIYSGGLISGKKDLVKSHINKNWSKNIVKNYWRDLSLAQSITENIVQPNLCNKTQFLSVLQPGNPKTDLEKEVWTELVSSKNDMNSNSNWSHVNLSGLSTQLHFTDIIHITQESREIVAQELSNIVYNMLVTNCK